MKKFEISWEPGCGSRTVVGEPPADDKYVGPAITEWIEAARFVEEDDVLQFLDDEDNCVAMYNGNVWSRVVDTARLSK